MEVFYYTLRTLHNIPSENLTTFNVTNIKDTNFCNLFHNICLYYTLFNPIALRMAKTP